MSLILNRLTKLILPTANKFSKSNNVLAHNLAEAVENEKQELFLDSENCILVDANDKNVGFASKRDCHKVEHDGIRLHRAFSVFLFNKNGDMLLQKRSSHKVSWIVLIAMEIIEEVGRSPNLHKTTCRLNNHFSSLIFYLLTNCWPSTIFVHR